MQIFIQSKYCIIVGIPATLNYISLDTNRGGSPKLTPYPNWAQNKAGACGSAITTAYRYVSYANITIFLLLISISIYRLIILTKERNNNAKGRHTIF